MAGGNDNKTERPTPRKLQKTREKGQIARSKEIPLAGVLLGMLGVLYYGGERLFNALEFEMRDKFRLQTPPDFTVSYVSGMITDISVRLAGIVGSILLAAMVFAVASNVVQGGLVFSWDTLGIHFEKLNPKNGLGKLFSKNGIVELAKGLLLLIVISIISYGVISRHLDLYPRLVLMDIRQIIHWIVSISYDVFLRSAAFLGILALADYAFQKYRFLEQLKMTKQEVKDEFKDMEGDPLIRGRIRRLQREMARKRMMTDVPTADVVITNPTHYAVALSYKMEEMEAPQVVAKGVGFLALKIKELAQKHDVPIVENKPLAQTLYKTVDIGQFIPADLYKAVAEILAYIFKARNAWKRN
jgi:flagellar biosynthesis protein FlhB